MQSSDRDRPRAAAVTDPDYYPLLVANTIYVGAFGSRLVENIREDKGYTYSPDGAIAARQKGGLLTATGRRPHRGDGATLHEIFYEQDRLGRRCRPRRSSSAPSATRAASTCCATRSRAVANTLASNWVKGLPPEALGEFVSKVNAVTADQVRAAGRSVLPLRRPTVVVVGEEAKVKEELAPFGEATVLKP